MYQKARVHKRQKMSNEKEEEMIKAEFEDEWEGRWITLQTQN